MAAINTKNAFVFSPFSPEFEYRYINIFRPALEASGYTVSSDKPTAALTSNLSRFISNADLILCDVGERDINTFFMLGYACGRGKRTICVAREADEIPVRLPRSEFITYDHTAEGWENKLRNAIQESILAGISPQLETATALSKLEGLHLNPLLLQALDNNWTPIEAIERTGHEIALLKESHNLYEYQPHEAFIKLYSCGVEKSPSGRRIIGLIPSGRGFKLVWSATGKGLERGVTHKAPSVVFAPKIEQSEIIENEEEVAFFGKLIWPDTGKVRGSAATHKAPSVVFAPKIEQSEIIENEEEVAFEVLCKVLDRLNTDIEGLTNKLKTSLDHLDKVDSERRTHGQNY